MLLKKIRRTNDGNVSRVHQDVMMALKVDEVEVGAAAGSAGLYDGIRLRIAAGQREQRGEARAANSGLARGLSLILGQGSLRWGLTGAAILLLAGLAMFLLLPRPADKLAGGAITQPKPVEAAPDVVQPRTASTISEQASTTIAEVKTQAGQPRRSSRVRRRSTSNADEVATDFLPLTYTADSTVPENRHVVHVRIPRSALMAFGLPMNFERAGELIRADVVIGDDGLARAIRFIQ